MMRRDSRNVGKYTFMRTFSRHKRTGPQKRRAIRASVPRRQRSQGGCFFQWLPVEVLHIILDKLSVLDISMFCLVSKEITSHVVDYISTQTWRTKMLIESFHCTSVVERESTLVHYRNLGLLFKRCTMLIPTKERLKFIQCKLSQIPCFVLENCLLPDCTGLSSFGVFLQTMISGWDELECQRVFDFFCDIMHLLQKVNAVMTGEPGTRRYQELQLRLFCRQVLLDPWQRRPECQFWLTLILKPWPLAKQARLLLILYGPLRPDGRLAWQELWEEELSCRALFDLASAILLLFSKEIQDETASSMLTILEELFVIPFSWHVENRARLLVLCGSSVCYTYLASKAISGQLDELSRLLVHIILVCEKDAYHMSWVVKVVQQLCKAFYTTPERLRFIYHLEKMFSEVTKDIFEFSFRGNHVHWRAFEDLCVFLDSSAHFHMKFLNMLLNY